MTIIGYEVWRSCNATYVFSDESDSVAQGRVPRAEHEIAAQFDAGRNLFNLDWAQVVQGTFVGGIVGGAMGVAFAVAAPLIPYSCAVATVLGVAASVNELKNSYGCRS